MNRFAVSLVASLTLATLLAAGCSQAPAAPVATSAPAKAAATTAPAAPAATTAPAAAQPAAPTAPAAAVPAKKSAFPEAGRTVTLVVAYAAGGGADIAARVLAPALEKELGVTVQIVNRVGAGSQVAVQSVASAKPDGYTIGYGNFPTVPTLYMDKARQAAFGRKDLKPVAFHVKDPNAITVRADSPFKSIKDVVDAAKAKPDTIKFGTSGLMSPEDFAFLRLAKLADIKINIVAFDGAAPGFTALLGGHIDVEGSSVSSAYPHIKSGAARAIATHEPEGGLLPGVKSMEEQGYTGFFGVSRGWFVPAGTPDETVNVLSAAMKKVMDTEEHKKKIMDIGQVVVYQNPEQFSKTWDDMEAFVKPFMEEVRNQ